MNGKVARSVTLAAIILAATPSSAAAQALSQSDSFPSGSVHTVLSFFNKCKNGSIIISEEDSVLATQNYYVFVKKGTGNAYASMPRDSTTIDSTSNQISYSGQLQSFSRPLVAYIKKLGYTTVYFVPLCINFQKP